MAAQWKKIAVVKVEARGTAVWQAALSHVDGQRLLRLTAVDRDEDGAPVPTTWTQCATTAVTADGLLESKSGLLLATAPRGALIGKLGGSTADVPDSLMPSAPFGTRRVFAVGSFCVINLAVADAGPLFLAMNDSTDSMAGHSGSLHILIEEFLL